MSGTLTFDEALRAQILRNKAQRARSLLEIVQEALPTGTPFEIMGVGLCHSRIAVPAEHLEPVRAAVERERPALYRVDYVPMETGS